MLRVVVVVAVRVVAADVAAAVVVAAVVVAVVALAAMTAEPGNEKKPLGDDEPVEAAP